MALEAYQPFYRRGLQDHQEKEKSSIANVFRTQAHNNARGNLTISGLMWYLFGNDSVSSEKAKKQNPSFNGPALFKDVFDKDHTPVKTEMVHTKKNFETILNDAFNSGKDVGINIRGSGYGHAITLWGAAFDEDGNIIAVYVVDNNYQPNRIFPYGIHYRNDIYAGDSENLPYLFNFPNNAADNDKHIGEITTLDRGEAQWNKWLSTH